MRILGNDWNLPIFDVRHDLHQGTGCQIILHQDAGQKRYPRSRQGRFAKSLCAVDPQANLPRRIAPETSASCRDQDWCIPTLENCSSSGVLS